jgi:DNA mismatch repair protein MLH1
VPLEDEASSGNSAKAAPSEDYSDHGDKEKQSSSLDHGRRFLQRTVQHLIFPALKTAFSPPKLLASDGSVQQIAALESLYKVFERC